VPSSTARPWTELLDRHGRELGDRHAGDAQIVLASGTNAAGSPNWRASDRARYVSANQNGFRAVVQLSAAGTAQNTKKWGVAWGSTMPTVTDGGVVSVRRYDVRDRDQQGKRQPGRHGGDQWELQRQPGGDLDARHDAVTYEIYWTNSK